MSERVLVRINGAASAAMTQALHGAALPIDDLDDALACYELCDGLDLLGWAALDRRGADALLRSVVIPPAGRGLGIGSDLITRLMDIAAGEGIERLWLLTETAEPFFARLGFARVPRESAPAPIRETSEFRTVCPASAACMTRRLS